MQWAIRDRAKIKALILIDAVLPDRPKNWRYRLRLVYDPLFRIIQSKWFPDFIRHAAASAYLGVPSSDLIGGSGWDYSIMARIHSNCQVTANPADLRIPVLMIWGAEDRVATPLENAIATAGKITQAEIRLVKGGHDGIFLFPDSIVTAIQNATRKQR